MWLEVLLFCLLVLVLRYYITKPKNLPPGPFALPYVGCKPVLSVKRIKECRKKHGDIFMTEMFGIKTVFLCNYNLIKEAFLRTDITDRPKNDTMHFVTDGVEAGVIMTNGKHWQNARRFLLRNLRDMGMGKTYLEKAIQEEAKLLVDDFRSVSGSPTLFPNSINIAVLNVVWQMVTSKRYKFDDEKILRIIKIIKGTETNAGVILLFLFPKVAKMFPEYIRRTWMHEGAIKKLRDETKSLCKELIETHRESLDPDHPRDIIDEYLMAMDAKSDIATYFNEIDLTRIIYDLFTAGFDTVSNTLRWFIIYMAGHPEVQRRVQQQIDEVVPRDTLPTYEHRARLPLVEATIHEVLRKSSLIAMGVQHVAHNDLHLAGYLIPKGTWVNGIAVCCHDDPQYWEQPDQFRLEHFLDEEGNFVSQKKGFLPFSIGRRNCLGEALARMELYVFIGALLQNFTFSAPEGIEIDFEASSKHPSIQLAKEQDIVITARK